MSNKKIKIINKRKKATVEIDESVFKNLSNLEEIDNKMQEYSNIYN